MKNLNYSGLLAAIAKLMVLATLATVLSPSLLFAQHGGHTMVVPADSPFIARTNPADDAALAAAPGGLELIFVEEVRLVKLVLRNADQEIQDIGFRYEPGAAMGFSQTLPTLSESDYYRVEWAALDGQGSLLRGRFHFSFGAEAEPPSYYLNQMPAMEHSMGSGPPIMVPADN